MARRKPAFTAWRRPALPDGHTFAQLSARLDEDATNLAVDLHALESILAACNTTLQAEKKAGRISEILIGWYRDSLERGEETSHAVEYLLGAQRLLIHSPTTFRSQPSLRVH